MEKWTDMYQRGKDGRVVLTADFALLPVITKEDTEFGKKEKYADIVGVFQTVSKNIDKKDTGYFLATLIDTIEVMSMEIYEQYRTLQDIFRKQARKLLAAYKSNSCEADEAGAAAYAILKGCRIGCLLKEKYLPVGFAMAKTITDTRSNYAAKLKQEEAQWKSNY